MLLREKKPNISSLLVEICDKRMTEPDANPLPTVMSSRCVSRLIKLLLPLPVTPTTPITISDKFVLQLVDMFAEGDVYAGVTASNGRTHIYMSANSNWWGLFLPCARIGTYFVTAAPAVRLRPQH